MMKDESEGCTELRGKGSRRCRVEDFSFPGERSDCVGGMTQCKSVIHCSMKRSPRGLSKVFKFL